MREEVWGGCVVLKVSVGLRLDFLIYWFFFYCRVFFFTRLVLECLESKVDLFLGIYLCRSLEMIKFVYVILRVRVKIVKKNWIILVLIKGDSIFGCYI